MRLGLRPAASLILFAAGLAPGCASAPTPLEDSVATITIAEPDRYYVAGDDIRLGVSLYNPGDTVLRIDDDLGSGDRLELLDAGGEPQPLRQPAPERAAVGETLAPGEKSRLELDLQRLFPALRRAGDYRLTVVYPRFRSNTVGLQVLPAFDRDAEYHARIETDRGVIVVRLLPDLAPLHVKNFINLARSGFYDDILFHRIVPRSIIQAGDPTRSGSGGPGHTVRGEFSDLPHERGTLSMARSGTDPNSAGSQWFICLERLEELDGMYTIFGEVIDGIEVADAIGRVRVEREVPKEAVVIERIVITEEKSSPPGAGTENG